MTTKIIVEEKTLDGTHPRIELLVSSTLGIPGGLDGYVQQAAASAAAASTSEANAATSETNAANSETNAANSAAAASTSETNAANSATAAATSETNAANSAAAASTSETNAATSETNAANSATAAATSETNAANSASAALTSENNAAVHALVMSEQKASAIWAQNQEKYAASDFVHFGKHYNTGDNHTEVNEGLWTNLGVSNILALGDAAGRAGVSKTSLAALHVAGVIAELRAINNSGDATSVLTLPEAPDGTVTYDSADGTVTQHVDAATAFAAETATNKVVTDRVDLVGLETWDEEITDDEVFPFTVQNQSTTFGDTDVPTVLSTRPDSYFQVYDGQTGISKGRCVKWSTLTETQKRKVAEYLGESFYVGENGLLVQRRVRQRSMAGPGNGDWAVVNPVGNAYIRYSGVSKPLAQAASDTPQWFTTDGTINFVSAESTFNNSDSQDVGVWIARQGEGINAYKGRCWFYVIATVPRLNQGAYHPSFNALGTDFTQGTDNLAKFWHDSAAEPVNTKADCFNRDKKGSSTVEFGSIASGASGHPDGLFYDAIYASGQGGVIDHRSPLGAWKTSPEKVWEKLLDVYNGSYRGEEKLAFTKVGTVTTTGSVFSDGYTKLIGSGQRYSSDFAEWDGYQLTLQPWDIEGSFILGDDGTVYPLGHIDLQVDADSGCYVSKSAGNVAANFTGGTYDVVILRRDWLNLSVSGEFTQTYVIGDPANILLTDALKDGWLGSWIPVIPDGTAKEFLLTRKSLDTVANRVNTGDNGATWGTTTATISAVTNAWTATMGAAEISLLTYTAFAKQTKQSSNKPVKWGKGGLGNVFECSYSDANFGCVLAEATLGVVLKASNSAPTVPLYGNLGLTVSRLFNDGKLVASTSWPTRHIDVSLGAPDNNSSGLKVLPLIFEENGQINLGFIANELKHDGVDWGDDSTIKIIEDGTYTNDNAETCKAVIHELAIPLGWERNEV